MTLPIAISVEPANAACKETSNSGADVPPAITMIEITMGLIESALPSEMVAGTT